MDIAATISAISAAIGLAKELRSVDAQIDQASLKLKIADLTSALAEAKMGLTEVADRLREKDEEISRLNASLQFRKAKLVDKGEFRYFADETGDPKGFPICPRCELKGEYLKVTQDRSRGAGRAVYVCPGCKANFGHHVTHF